MISRLAEISGISVDVGMILMTRLDVGVGNCRFLTAVPLEQSTNEPSMILTEGELKME